MATGRRGASGFVHPGVSAREPARTGSRRIHRAGCAQRLRNVSSGQRQGCEASAGQGRRPALANEAWKFPERSANAAPRSRNVRHDSHSLDHKIPALDEELADVDSVLDWRPIAHPASVEDNKWERHVHMRSELLSKFWGRPTEISAVVLMPDGWDEHPDARYPVLISEDHYHRHFFPGFRTTPPDPAGEERERHLQQSAWRFFQDWTSGRLPRVLIVMPQHANPYFDDSYAVTQRTSALMATRSCTSCCR